MKHSKKYIIVIVIALIALGLGYYFGQSKDIANYAQARNAYYVKSLANTKGPKFSDKEKQIMEDAAKALKAKMPNPGLKVGSKAPDFTLGNAFGKKVTLSTQLKQGPVVLVFYRGAWCPFCNLHLKSLNDSLPQFKQYGASLITVTPQTPDKSAGQLKKAGYPFEVLSDLDSTVMKDYKLYFELDPELVKLYKAKGLDLEAFNGKGRNLLPIPGSFVIAQDGTIVAMHADTDYKERMEPADIVAALKQLKTK